MNELKQRTVSASYLETLLDAFSEAGGSRENLLKQAGLNDAALADPDNRLPVDAVTKIWVAVRDETSDPLLGLKVGAHIRPGSFSVLGHLLMTAATLRDALEKASKFAVLVGDGGIFSVTHRERDSIAEYDLAQKNIPCREERIEAVMASLVGFARWITGENITPAHVCFTHKPLGDLKAYKEIFLTEPEFNSQTNSVVLSKEDLKRPLLQSNPELSAVLDEHAQKVMSRVTQIPGFLVLFRQSLKKYMQENSPELNSVATDLGLTPRSLQRKLADLDTSFLEQLNVLRRDVAIQRLEKGDGSISEIAFAVGFSDPASFSRAFKRWTGKPPGKWADEQALNPPASDF